MRNSAKSFLFNQGLHYALLACWHYFTLAEEEMHSQVGLSATHLCRLFKQQAGASMVDFQVRVERLRALDNPHLLFYN